MWSKTPQSWLSKWDGPEDPMQYLRGLVGRAVAVSKWVDKVESGTLLTETLDLGSLFHPDTFLNAVRQQTARYSMIHLMSQSHARVMTPRCLLSTANSAIRMSQHFMYHSDEARQSVNVLATSVCL